MKIKTQVLFLFFLAIPFLLSAQKNKEYKNYTNYYYRNIEWGDRQYDNSMRGIILLMDDVKKNDQKLYLRLNEAVELYEKNKKRGNRSILIGVIGGVIFGALAYENHYYDPNRAGAFLLTGIVVFSGGIYVGKKRRISERKFIYNFTTMLNENTEGKKVKYTVRPSINLNHNPSLGLSFSLNF